MVIKSHILIMEARSCRLWRMDLCRQAREENRVFAVFQILHSQYSTKTVLKDVLWCPVMCSSLQKSLCSEIMRQDI